MHVKRETNKLEMSICVVYQRNRSSKIGDWKLNK